MQNSKAIWALQIDSAVEKQLKKIPLVDARRVVKAVQSIASDPYAGDIRKIQGLKNSWRRRTGNYRIFYKILPDEKVIIVSRVERRTSKTY